MKRTTATTLRNVARKVGASEEHATLMGEAMDMLASKQPNGIVKVTEENRMEIAKQVADLAVELQLQRENQSETFLLLQRWESEFYDFVVEQSDILMNNESQSLDVKNVGVDFLKFVYGNMEDIFVELYRLSLTISDFNGKELQLQEVENVFGEGFKYEPYYKNGDKGIVKHLNDISHIHVMSVMVPHEQPVVFPITSYDTVIRVEYNAILKTEHGNFRLRIELNDLNLEALKFTFVAY